MNGLWEDWSWPPPGLERLRGVLRTAARRGTFGTALAGGTLLWLVLARAIDRSETLGFLASLAIAVGIFAYLGGILRAAAALDLARGAARLGYSRAVILDVLADRGDDTAALVAGIGPFAELRPRIRATMRSLRRAAALTALAGALLPLPLFCIGIWLALRGAAAPLSVALLLLAPALLLWTTTGVLRGYAILLAQWERGAAAWDPAPVSTSERAAEWRRRFLPDEPNAGVRRTGLLALAAAAGGGIVAFIFLFLTASVVGILTAWTEESGYRPSDLEYRTAARVEAYRPLRTPPDGTVDAAAAGRALHALLTAADDTIEGMLPPEPEYPPLWPATPGVWNAPRTLWDRLTRDGPASPTLQQLRAQPAHPALAALALLGRADSVDPLLARWGNRVPPAHVWYRGEGSAHPAVLRPIADAANAWRAGDSQHARAVLRDLLAAGLLLVDHGRTRAELELGASMAQSAGQILVRIGHTALPVDSALALAAQRAGRHSVGDVSLYPALRWEAFRRLQRRERCGSPAALLFSGTSPRPAWRADAERLLLHSRGDSLAFASLTQRALPLPRGSRWYRRIERGVRAVSGEHLLQNPCFVPALRGG